METRRSPQSPAGSAEVALLAVKADIAALIRRGVDGPRNDQEFNDLALRLFECQFRLDEPYRRYCERRGRTPETVSHWKEVPGVPIGAFKQALFACGPVDTAEALFMTSGTTDPSQRGRHYHLTLDLYNLSATTNFAAHFLPDGVRLKMLILNPPFEQAPNSALTYYLDMMGRRYGAEGTDFFVGSDGLDVARLTGALRNAEQRGEPLGLLAATFAYVHFLDHCQSEGLAFRLPDGSRVFDTGGVKGKSREVGQDALYASLSERLGVPEYACVNMYGMTESSTQFIDDTLRNHHRGIASPRAKTIVPWARSVILDPETMAEAGSGKTGLLQDVDLANYGSAMVLLTEDLGRAVGSGFELVGRARGTEARGCSIAIDELLSAARGSS